MVLGVIQTLYTVYRGYISRDHRGCMGGMWSMWLTRLVGFGVLPPTSGGPNGKEP